MMSLPNEEAKIEQLIRQLATISPPFVNSREELKQLTASIYLLADQLTGAVLEDAAEEKIIDLPPLTIPESRPIFADHSNPVLAVSEESIEEELQWQAAPTPPVPTETIPQIIEVPVLVEAPVADPIHAAPIVPPAEPNLIEPELRSNPEPRDLFEQANTPPLADAPLVQEELTIPIAEPIVTPPAVETPLATPEPVVMPLVQEEPKTERIEIMEPPVPAPPAVPVTPPALPVTPPALPVTPPAEPVTPPQAVPVTPPQAVPLRNVDRDLQRALPLVRRLEFINRLFNGNDGEWQLFCQDVNRCYSTSDALQIYRESYIRYGWEKHAEMADLLKQLIVKTFG